MTAPTTIVKSDVYTGLQPMRTMPIGSEVLTIAVPFVFPVAAPAANDTQAIVKIPLGVRVVDWSIQSEDLDSATNADFTLGTLDATTLDLSTTWKTGVVVGQAGTLLRAADSVAAMESSAAERVVGIKWVTGAAGGYAASKKGLLILKLVG